MALKTLNAFEWQCNGDKWWPNFVQHWISLILYFPTIFDGVCKYVHASHGSTPLSSKSAPPRDQSFDLCRWFFVDTVFFFSFLYNNNQVDWINKSNSQTMFIPLYPTQREMNHVWAGCLRCLEAEEEVSPVSSPGRRHESPSLARGWQTSQLGRGGSDCQFSGKQSNVSNISANSLIRTRLCINISILWVICFCFGLLVNISRPTPTQ